MTEGKTTTAITAHDAPPLKMPVLASDGSNWISWAYHVQLAANYFELEEYLEHVDKEIPNNGNSRKLQLMINGNLAPDLQSLADLKNFNKTYLNLKARFARNSEIFQTRALNKLKLLKASQSATITDYLATHENHVQELLNVGGNITELEKCRTLMDGLDHPDWTVFRRMIDLSTEQLLPDGTITNNNITYSYLKNRVHEEAVRIGNQSSTNTTNTTLFTAKANISDPAQNRYGKKRMVERMSVWKPDLVCWNCNGIGHGHNGQCTSAQNPIPQEFRPKSRSNNNDQVLFIDSKPINEQRSWYPCLFASSPSPSAVFLDGGCSISVFTDQRFFINLQHYSQPKSVSTIAGDQNPIIEGHGAVRFYLGDQQVELPHAFYAPRAITQIISQGQLLKLGFSFSTFGQTTKIYSQDKEIVCEARWFMDHEHHPPVVDIKPFVAYAQYRTPISVDLAHQRLAHVAFSRIAKLNGLTTIGTASHCTVCPEAKAKSLPHSSSKEKKYKSIGDLIVSDYKGPLPDVGYHGELGLIVYKDAASGLAGIFPVARKSEQLATFNQFCAWLERQGSCQVKRVRHDKGGEYSSKEFLEQLRSRGIENQTTAGYSPESNGIAERHIGVLFSMIRAVYKQADYQIPKNLWPEIAMACNHIYNRVPQEGLGWKSPMEILEKRPSSINHLRVLGCKAYVLIPDPYQTALGPRAKVMRLIGYGIESATYRLFDGKRIHESRDVTFDESCFKFNYGDAPSEPIKTTHVHQDPAPETVIHLPDGISHEAPIPEADNLEDSEETDSDDGSSSSHESYHSTELDTDSSNDSQSTATPTSTGPTGGSRPNTHRDGYYATQEEYYQSVGSKEFRPYTEGGSMVIAGQRKSRRLNDPEVLLTRIIETAQDSLFLAALIQDIPKNYKTATTGTEKSQWIVATKVELESLLRRGTFRILDIKEVPAGCKIIGSTWVFAKKTDAQGNVTRHKARLCAMGNQLEPDEFSYIETFSPTININTVHLLCTIAGHLDYECTTIDIKNAYLYSDITEEVYMRIPEGMSVDGKGKVLKVEKGLYGLPQAGRAWNLKFKSDLEKLGWTHSKKDPCLFSKPLPSGKRMYFGLYVDDGFIAAPNRSDIEAFVQDLRQLYELTESSNLDYLGLRIKRDRKRRVMQVSQPGYIDKMLKHYGQEQCAPRSIPMDAEFDGVPDPDQPALSKDYPYRELIGSLMHISRFSRPDIALAVGILSCHLHDAQEKHWIAAIQVLQYLKQTRDYHLELGGTETLTLRGSSDASWGDPKQGLKPRNGSAITLGSSVICATSKLRKTAANSTTHAELAAMSETCRDLEYYDILLSEIFPDRNCTQIELFTDSQTGIKSAEASRPSHASRNIQIADLYIRDLINAKRIKLTFTRTGEILADGLTKPLGKNKFNVFRSKLGIRATQDGGVSQRILLALSPKPKSWLHRLFSSPSS
jgi:hypothetical protein